MWRFLLIFLCALMVMWIYDKCISLQKKNAKENFKMLLYWCLVEGIHNNRWKAILVFYVCFILGSSLEHWCYMTYTRITFKDWQP